MSQQDRLLEIYGALPETERHALLSYAEFLGSRNDVSVAAESEASSPDADDEIVARPLDYPRPAKESVVAAIRRLSKTYPMINTDHLMDETSIVMSSHLMKGVSAPQAIDELEALFYRHYVALTVPDDQQENER